MRKLFVAAAALGALAVPAGALADGGGYGSQPGYLVANSNTSCAGHGAFGAFSGNPGVIEEYVDADQAAGISLGSETGPANSNLCGDPHN
jgi:hypothetical protein